MYHVFIVWEAFAREFWKRLRKFEGSTLFLVLFLIGLILFQPVKLWIDVTILKYELKQAVMAYAEEHCGTKVKVKKVRADIVHSPFSYFKKWSAVTEPDLRLGGTFYDEYVIIDYSLKCSTGRSLILDRELHRFVVSNESLPPPRRGPTPKVLYIYFWVVVGVAFIYMILWSLEDKKKKRE